MDIRALVTLALLVSSVVGLSKDVPQLSYLPRDPAVDPSVDDLNPAVELAVPVKNEREPVRLRLGLRSGDVLIGARIARALKPSEALRMGLHFVNSGSEGRALMFGPHGINLAETHLSMASLVRGEVKNSRDLYLARARVAVKALPRFPSKGPVLLEICATFEPKPAKLGDVSVCVDGQATVAIRFPDEFRNRLELKLEERVIAVEGRPKGWVGYPALFLPVWLQGDTHLNAAAVRELATGETNQPETIQIPLPKRLVTPDGRVLVPVYIGREPFSENGKCDSSQELRLGLYAVKGLNAVRTLEWPAINCTLGRIVTVILDDDGDLTIGYSNGPTASFVWSGDHFERTEIGAR